jgi:hypothetical protein
MSRAARHDRATAGCDQMVWRTQSRSTSQCMAASRPVPGAPPLVHARRLLRHAVPFAAAYERRRSWQLASNRRCGDHDGPVDNQSAAANARSGGVRETGFEPARPCGHQDLNPPKSLPTCPRQYHETQPGQALCRVSVPSRPIASRRIPARRDALVSKSVSRLRSIDGHLNVPWEQCLGTFSTAAIPRLPMARLALTSTKLPLRRLRTAISDARPRTMADLRRKGRVQGLTCTRVSGMHQ